MLRNIRNTTKVSPTTYRRAVVCLSVRLSGAFHRCHARVCPGSGGVSSTPNQRTDLKDVLLTSVKGAPHAREGGRKVKEDQVGGGRAV